MISRLSFQALGIVFFTLAIGVHADDGGTGPPVGDAFSAAPFDAAGQPESIFVAWRDGQALIHSGLLRLDDGSFDAFPDQTPPRGVTNLHVGVGGPSNARRAYVAWVDNTLDLMLLVFDANGGIVAAPQAVANAVQVAPLRFSGTDTGVLIAYSWGAHPNWDPRVLRVDTQGVALSEEIVEDVSQQTLGVDVAAAPHGPFAVAYMTGSPGPGAGAPASVRRYDDNGPLEPPVLVPENLGAGAYVPEAFLITPSDTPPLLFVAVKDSSGGFADTRFVTSTFFTSSPLSVGPLLSELSPAFPGNVADIAALTGLPNLVVCVWEEIDLQDPCQCSIPPPVRVEIRAQALAATPTPSAFGQPFTVHLWEEGDAFGAPLTPPVIVPSQRSAAEFTVLWSDGLLRYKRGSAIPVGNAVCFGDGGGTPCPCGNDSPTAGEGCQHSGGRGMTIEAFGSTSITADDLSMTAHGCPPGNTGIFYAGQSLLGTGNPLFDGLQCAGGSTIRFRGQLQETGVVADSDFVTQDVFGLFFVPGVTYYFQYFSRDNQAGPSPCGGLANLSPAYAVTMTP